MRGVDKMIKNKKSFNHFFGKYAIVSQLSSYVMLFLPYPKFIINQASSLLIILIMVLFITSVLATQLENVFEKKPFCFKEKSVYGNIYELESILEQLKSDL